MPLIRPLAIILTGYVLLAGTLAYVAHQSTLANALTTLSETGSVRLNEASSRLRLQIDGYRALANFIAGEPLMARALAAKSFDDIPSLLEDFKLTYGAWRIDLVDADNQIIINTIPKSNNSATPTPAYSPSLFAAAMNGRLGFEHAIHDDMRLIMLSRGVRDDQNKALGAVIVSVDLSALEFEWPVTPEPLVFFDENWVSFSSNRPDLLGRTLGAPLGETPFQLRESGMVAGQQSWRFSPQDAQPQDVIVLSSYVPHLDLTGQVFLDMEPAFAAARLRLWLVLALASVLGLIGAVVVQQRRRITEEAQQSATLEARVEERTQELRRTQNELVEATKLSALGRLSAGISHELNQPLAAILNFAENGQQFIERHKPQVASENLAQISSQVRRMTRIIGNLRAFARQEITPTERIDFAQVTRDALALQQDDLARAGVTLLADVPGNEIPITAGQVRLEQVIVNLVTNAIDAMEFSDEKQLRVILRAVGDRAELLVQDTGSGIDDPDRVFEPFYTTKNLGASQGLGMGLALSFGIITTFGGQASCRNLERGAEFKITLPILRDQNAD